PDGGCSCNLPTETTFATALDPLYHNRYELAEWAKKVDVIGVNFIGLWCGASPVMIRSVAEAFVMETPIYIYSANVANHILIGTYDTLKNHNLEYRTKA